MHRSRYTFAAATLAAALLSGCSVADDAGGDAVGALKQEVRELARQNEQLSAKVEKLERRVNGNSDDIGRLAQDALRTERVARADVAAAPEEAPAAAMDGAAAALAQGGSALAALLETEQGQAAVEKAMAAAQEKRDAARRDQMITGMVDRFAVKAELTPDQTEKMREIAANSMTKIRDVWTSFREMRDLGPDERQAVLADNMAKMEQIRDDANQEAKAVLNSAQYLIYEEEMANMRGGFGGDMGGGRPGGGFGGRGGGR